MAAFGSWSQPPSWASLPAWRPHPRGAQIDGTPLNVMADGFGAIQIRQDGVAPGLFYDPDENPGHAGLEIKEGGSYYPLEAGFERVPGPHEPHAPGARRPGRDQDAVERLPGRPEPAGHRDHQLHGQRPAGEHPLRDRERLGGADLAARRCARGPLRRRQRRQLRRDRRRAAALHRRARARPPASCTACRRSPPGAPTRRATSRPSSATSAPTGSLNTVDSAAPDNGVGVEFAVDNLQPGERRDIDVRWLLAAPAPPGTVTPPRRAATATPAPPRR